MARQTFEGVFVPRAGMGFDKLGLVVKNDALINANGLRQHVVVKLFPHKSGARQHHALDDCGVGVKKQLINNKKHRPHSPGPTNQPLNWTWRTMASMIWSKNRRTALSCCNDEPDCLRGMGMSILARVNVMLEVRRHKYARPSCMMTAATSADLAASHASSAQ
jgi:hypothetical protein